MDSIKILISSFSSLLHYGMGMIYFYLIRIVLDINIIGQYDFLFSFFLTFSFITDLGVSIAHLKYFPGLNNDDEKGTHNSTFLLFKLVQFAIYSVFMIIITSIFIPFNEYNPLFIYLLFLSILLGLSINIFHPFFLSKKEVVKQNIPLIISDIIKSILLIIVANIFTKDLYLLTFILLFSNSILFLLNLILMRNFKFKKSTKEIKLKYLRFSLPYVLISSLIIITSNIDVLFINAWSNSQEVANYSTAKQIYSIFTLFLISISDIMLTTFSKNVELGNEKENLKLLSELHRILNILIVPLVLLIVLFSKDVIIMIFGNEYILSADVLSVLSLDLIVVSVVCGRIIYLKAIGDFKLPVISSFFRNSMAILLMILFISPYFLNFGALGAAVAVILSDLLTLMIFRPIFHKKYKIGFYWGSIRNVILMLFIILIHILIESYFQITNYLSFLLIPLYFGLYFSINFLLKGINKEDITFLMNVLSVKNIMKTISSESKDI